MSRSLGFRQGLQAAADLVRARGAKIRGAVDPERTAKEILELEATHYLAQNPEEPTEGAAEEPRP